MPGSRVKYKLRHTCVMVQLKRTYMIALAVIVLSFLLSIYLYSSMPEKMASHWNAQGEVDEYMEKSLAIFLFPSVTLPIFLLLIFIPRIDPLKKNIEKFREHYDIFIVIFVLYMSYIHTLTILWNFGYKFDMLQLMAPAFAALFYYAGVMMENSKMNWFIGIRTPWTLSNEVVWNKTHKMAGKWFKVVGVIAVFGALTKIYAIYLLVGPVVAVSLYAVAYSYFEYQKQTK